MDSGRCSLTINQRHSVNPKSGRTWINFKELRAKLKFEDVLRHYGVEIKRKGAQHNGACPLPGHGGTRDKPVFSANLERGIFQCFGCRASGNLLEFAGLMEGANLSSGLELRKVAVKLRDKLVARETESPKPVQTEIPVEPKKQSVLVNAPLDFELKGLDPAHSYLARRGFTTETMAYFGVGYCSRGLLADRVAIPLHDPAGKLIGYAGRAVNETEVTIDNPRYVFPEERERQGVVLKFDKGLFLYNGHRIAVPCADLAIVEGFPSVWWLHQHGIRSAVATMGTTCSQEQIEQILKLVPPTGQVWLMPDGNAPGERLAQALLGGIAPHRFVRWIQLGKDRQPTDLSGVELDSCFAL